jgi:predicted ATPase
MISEIDFSGVKQSKTFGYAAGIKFFQKHQSVKFKPGLNILYGPNGCGKSTILRMAALVLAAEQGGVSTITSSWLQDVFGFGEPKLQGIKVTHDGQPIMYGNPRNAVGLFGGGAAFDDDFMDQGLANIQSKASTGLTTMNRLNVMFAVALGKAPFPDKVDDRLKYKSDKSYTAALELLKASLPKGQRTLIFDEPESGLAIPVQGNLFNLLFQAAKQNDLQIILATHSAFSLALPDCNYIEMEPDYIEQSRNAISTVHMRVELERLTSELTAKVAKRNEKAASEPDPDSAESPPSTKPVRKRRASTRKAQD